MINVVDLRKSWKIKIVYDSVKKSRQNKWSHLLRNSNVNTFSRIFHQFSVLCLNEKLS